MAELADLLLRDPRLILLGLDAGNAEAVLRTLSDRLLDGAYVAATFPEALLEREASYPTGLPAEGLGVAIPHADPEHVRVPAVALATLNQPVRFQVMGDPQQEVEVSVVFLLALNNPDGQLSVLRQVAELVQSPERVVAVHKAATLEDVREAVAQTRKESA